MIGNSSVQFRWLQQKAGLSGLTLPAVWLSEASFIKGLPIMEKQAHG